MKPLAQKLADHQQVTDAYLLGLAIHKRGKLATMDRAVRTLLPDKSPERDFAVLI
jgi:predicted nucleic acid-binding protein